MAWGHFKNFPNDKCSRKDVGEYKVPGLGLNKEEDKIVPGCSVVRLQDGRLHMGGGGGGGGRGGSDSSPDR